MVGEERKCHSTPFHYYFFFAKGEVDLGWWLKVGCRKGERKKDCEEKV